MKERPIIFSAPMVRAILAGTKSQTRRIVKPQPPSAHGFAGFTTHSTCAADEGKAVWAVGDVSGTLRDARHVACQYGAPGDRLWVRETWFRMPHPTECGITKESIPGTWDLAVAAAGRLSYRADPGSEVEIDGMRWRSPIHMPRQASRILLEVTDVRVERLQDISEADALSEGCVAEPFPGPWWQGYKRTADGELHHQEAVGESPPDWMIEPHRMRSMAHCDRSAVDNFRSLWFDINGADSWAANPWVWAISFRRATP